jgi:hypothetical protein
MSLKPFPRNLDQHRRLIIKNLRYPPMSWLVKHNGFYIAILLGLATSAIAGLLTQDEGLLHLGLFVFVIVLIFAYKQPWPIPARSIKVTEDGIHSSNGNFIALQYLSEIVVVPDPYEDFAEEARPQPLYRITIRSLRWSPVFLFTRNKQVDRLRHWAYCAAIPFTDGRNEQRQDEI